MIKTKFSIKKWTIRFIKFNLIGTVVFGISTGIYAFSFPTFHAWSWLVANSFGGIMQFSLTTYINKKNKGLIFETGR